MSARERERERKQEQKKERKKERKIDRRQKERKKRKGTEGKGKERKEKKRKEKERKEKKESKQARKKERKRERERERAGRACAMDGLLGSCPPLVLVLAAPLNSVAGLCGRLCVRVLSSSCPCLGRAPELCGLSLWPGLLERSVAEQIAMSMPTNIH